MSVTIICAIAPHCASGQQEGFRSNSLPYGQGAIGYQQQLLCHLSADLRRFKYLTLGNTVIMGRKTFESLPKGALPQRQNIVLSHDRTLQIENATVVYDMKEALAKAENSDIFIIGGASVYKEALPLADKMELTLVHHTFEQADTFFPEIDESQWRLVSAVKMKADEKNRYDYTFASFVRK